MSSKTYKTRLQTNNTKLQGILDIVTSLGISIITFTIGEAEYQASNIMTWETWCDSSFNTRNYFVNDGYVIRVLSSGSIRVIALNGNPVSSTDTIVAGGEYETIAG